MRNSSFTTVPNSLEPVELWYPRVGYIVKLKVIGGVGDDKRKVGKYLTFQICSKILNGGIFSVSQILTLRDRNYFNRKSSSKWL